MASVKQYTPKRRVAMQVVMWALLLATVLLAGLVSSHRRSVFQTKLGPPVENQGVSIQLPIGWGIVRNSSEDEAILFFATDAENEERVLSVWSNPLDDTGTPAEMVDRQLRKNAAAQAAKTRLLSVDGHPAAITQGEVTDSRLGDVHLSFYVGAIAPPGRNAVLVEYYCINGDSSDADLLRRVLQSVQFKVPPASAPASLMDSYTAPKILPAQHQAPATTR